MAFITLFDAMLLQNHAAIHIACGVVLLHVRGMQLMHVRGVSLLHVSGVPLLYAGGVRVRGVHLLWMGVVINKVGVVRLVKAIRLPA